MQKIIFISAGMIYPKKTDNMVSRRIRYLNYGLLSLANSDMVPSGGVYHGHFDSPGDVISRVERDHAGLDDALFLISCPSYFALDWAREYVKLTRIRFPKSSIVFGGRWVVDGNISTFKKMMPEVNLFVEGLAEAQLSLLLNRNFRVEFRRTREADFIYDAHQISVLDYLKLNSPHEFVPSFEASRGCGAGCNFCAEANVKLTSLKPPELLCAEILGYRLSVNGAVDRYYLEASNFTPQVDWLQELYEQRKNFGIENIFWRTEARVDIFSERSIREAYRAGLRVLDLGLESASHTQLLRMKKTKSPATYLERASRLVRAASDIGILVKVNILLYPGETMETILDTLVWLRSHSDFISGVSVYPTVHYGPFDKSKNIISYYESLGASLVEPSKFFGISAINLSASVQYPESEKIAQKISREFMTADQYFTLKSFTYFDPRYTREDFYSDLEGVSQSLLPFSMGGLHD